jgi:hypothetical protein
MKSNSYKFYFLITSFLCIVAYGCNSNKEPVENQSEVQKPLPGYNKFEKTELTVAVFKVDSTEVHGMRGWGYDILADGAIYIHQPNVPAVMGNNGFSSEEKALKAGEFVIGKIRNNIVPPSVTPEELDSLGVLN